MNKVETIYKIEKALDIAPYCFAKCGTTLLAECNNVIYECINFDQRFAQSVWKVSQLNK